MKIKDKRTPGFEWGFFFACLTLVGCGIVLVYSSSFALAEAKYGSANFFLSRHALRVVFAVVGFAVFMNIDYHAWARIGHILFAIAVVLLIAVLISPHTHVIKGARRWISLGFVSFQVSEFARLALIVYLAKKIGEVKTEIRQLKVLCSLLGAIGLTIALVVVEPNFSTAVMMGTMGMAILFVAGARLRHLAIVGFAGLFLVAAGLLTVPYRLKRLLAFVDLEQNKSGTGFQTYQALIGLGNGGLFGKGLGQAGQKYFYLPEPHTDFAFAILGEEIGFVGMVVVLSVFAYLVWRGMVIAFRAPDTTGQIMAFGLTFALGAYVVLHGLVNTGLIPTTGVPLPFLSYGGMSLVFNMCSMGIVLNISSKTAGRMPLEMAHWLTRQRRSLGVRSL